MKSNPPRQKRDRKKIIRTLHLWLGLVSGIVVCIVSVTGALYVFEEEGRQLFQHHYYHIGSNQSVRLPLDQLADSFNIHYPEEKITSIRFKETPDAAFVFFTDDKLVSIDPRNGHIIGVRYKDRDFFTVVQKIHTELYLGEVGKEIVKWNVLIFFLLCISGLILWWPKQLNFWKGATRIKWKTASRKRLIWDLHSVLGFYALSVLLIISFTGMFWTFDSVKSFIATVTNSTVTPKKEKLSAYTNTPLHFSLQQAYDYTRSAYPGATETFVTPADKKNAAMRIIMRYPYTLVRKQNTFYFHSQTGKLLQAYLYNKQSGYEAYARANYDFHTGRIRCLGIGSKIIYFLVALTSASLPVTGFLIWRGKQKKRKKKYKKSAPVATTGQRKQTNC